MIYIDGTDADVSYDTDRAAQAAAALWDHPEPVPCCVYARGPQCSVFVPVEVVDDSCFD